MLLRFACRNFRSFRSEQELSLIAATGHEHEESLIEIPSLKNRVVRSAAIYGANASGKTNILRALSFFDWLIESSHERRGRASKIPREPFVLDGNDEPSYFEADFAIEGERYTYGFEVDDAQVQREWLYAFPSGRKVLWFERKGKEPINFGRSLAGKNRVIESLTRKNSLFLSTAAQNNHEQLSRIFEWFNRNFHVLRPERRDISRTAEICLKDSGTVRILKSLLKFADLGIVDFMVAEEEIDPTVKEVLGKMLRQGMPDDPDLEIPDKTKRVTLVHQGVGDKLYNIDAEEESRGTIAYLSILGPIFQALTNGAILLIDEFESSLHPVLAKEIVRLFNDPKINCKGGQFIFTTHDANLLNLDILRRDQIWFTEKDKSGASVLYPLSDFSVRSDFNVTRGYLQGRFGAIPFLNDSLLNDLERLSCGTNE